MAEKTNVVILGAGYAGLMALKVLQKRADASFMSITLVDQNPYHYEATDLHEVALGALTADRITYPIADVVNPEMTEFIEDRVTKVDRSQYRVELANHEAIGFDYLIIGLGFESEDFGIPGVREYALPMDSVDSAERIQQHITDEMFAYRQDNDPRHLHIVVAGAGFTGVELLGALSENRERYAEMAGVAPNQIQIMSVDGAKRPLSVFSQHLVDYGLAVLRGRGAVIESGKGINAIEPDVMHYADRETGESGEVIAGTIIWTTGVRGSSVMAASGYQAKRNRMSVTPYLKDPADDRIYIVGDVAAATDSETGQILPTTAQLALVMGEIAGKNVLAAVTGYELTPFTYKSLGTVCSIGNTSAIGVVGDEHEVRGYPASMLKKVIMNKSLLETGGIKQVMAKGRFDLYH
ncbi:NAD(P)/FAD-dependent oxidoreductase [Weissella cibaria]|uniref:NAD(P)/FAD-dependent oxidoreductase n=1 Tax=Weissella cibaria TaxID=137591 RepID=UPI0036D9C7F1